MSLYSRTTLLRALSLDSQARLTTDPSRQVAVGIGDGSHDTFDTPFAESSVLKGYVDGAITTGTSILHAAGSDGTDQIKFTTAPSMGEIVTASADGLAVNTTVVDEAMAQAEDILHGYVVSSGGTWPPSGDALEVIRPVFVGVTKWILRNRRDIDGNTGDMPVWISRWLSGLVEGKIRLPRTTTTAVTLTYRSDIPVFGEG